MRSNGRWGAPKGARTGACARGRASHGDRDPDGDSAPKGAQRGGMKKRGVIGLKMAVNELISGVKGR